MTSVYLRPLFALPLIALLFVFTGCDALEDIFEDDELEVEGVVEVAGDDFLTVEAIRYTVTGDTEYEGFADFSEIAVGDAVEIEYEQRGSDRVALEVEDSSVGDDD